MYRTLENDLNEWNSLLNSKDYKLNKRMTNLFHGFYQPNQIWIWELELSINEDGKPERDRVIDSDTYAYMHPNYSYNFKRFMKL